MWNGYNFWIFIVGVTYSSVITELYYLGADEMAGKANEMKYGLKWNEVLKIPMQ